MNLEVKLPADVANVFDLQKQISKVAIRGIGEVDFNTISLIKAKKVVEKTGSKYLAEKKFQKPIREIDKQEVPEIS